MSAYERWSSGFGIAIGAMQTAFTDLQPIVAKVDKCCHLKSVDDKCCHPKSVDGSVLSTIVASYE